MTINPLTTRFPASQREVGQNEALHRLRLARAYIQLTRAFADVAFPDRGTHLDMDLLLVLMAVGIGDGEGKPMNATKVAHYTGIPRTTVQRKLMALVQMGKVTRSGNNFRYATNGMHRDRRNLLDKAVEAISNIKLPPKMGTK